MGALTHNGEVLQSLPANASQINFDKTGTDLNSTQTENAIKEVNTKVNTNSNDIDQLKSGLTDLVKVKYMVYFLPSEITIPAHNTVSLGDIKTITGDTSAKMLLAGFLLSYNLSNLPLFIAQKQWYQGLQVDVTNVGDSAITIPANYEVRLAWI